MAEQKTDWIEGKNIGEEFQQVNDRISGVKLMDIKKEQDQLIRWAKAYEFYTEETDDADVVPDCVYDAKVIELKKEMNRDPVRWEAESLPQFKDGSWQSTGLFIYD